MKKGDYIEIPERLWLRGAVAGMRRQIHHHYRNTPQTGKPIYGSTAMINHINAACGEIAFAMATGQRLKTPQFVPTGRPKGPDVGRTDVKTVLLSTSTHLLISTPELHSEFYALLIGEAPCFQYWGWMDRETIQRTTRYEMAHTGFRGWWIHKDELLDGEPPE